MPPSSETLTGAGEQAVQPPTIEGASQTPVAPEIPTTPDLGMLSPNAGLNTGALPQATPDTTGQHPVEPQPASAPETNQESIAEATKGPFKKLIGFVGGLFNPNREQPESTDISLNNLNTRGPEASNQYIANTVNKWPQAS